MNYSYTMPNILMKMEMDYVNMICWHFRDKNDADIYGHFHFTQIMKNCPIITLFHYLETKTGWFTCEIDNA